MAEINYFIERRRTLQKERVFRDRSDPLAGDDDALIAKYRLPRHEILSLLSLISDDLKRTTRRNQPLLPIHQLCAALRFYGKGLFQLDNAELCGVVQSSISLAISRVTNSIIRHRTRFITFPENPTQIMKIKQGFFAMKGVPNVIGVIDGSHVFVRRPSLGSEEKLYVCRKGGHSINVQFICDHEMMLTNVVAKYPGSTNDAYIWRNCGLRRKWSENPPSGFILGDSGYPLETWLYTAILQPRSQAEIVHNTKIKGTRRIIENAIGLLKSRFRCIDRSGGILLYSPVKVCKIITVCSMLHNMRRGLHLVEDENLIDVTVERDDDHIEINDYPIQPNVQQFRETMIGLLS